MGNFFYRNAYPGISFKLQKETKMRILHSEQSINGICCNSCNAALKPLHRKKIIIPFYCHNCIIINNIEGTFGISELQFYEDKWLSGYSNLYFN